MITTKPPAPVPSTDGTAPTPSPPDDRPKFLLELEALPQGDDVPAVIRLRAFLKKALRVYRFRCTWGREGGRETDTKETPLT